MHPQLSSIFDSIQIESAPDCSYADARALPDTTAEEIRYKYAVLRSYQNVLRDELNTLTNTVNDLKTRFAAIR